MVCDTGVWPANPPLPVKDSVVGLTFKAATSPVLVTVISTVTSWFTSCTMGRIVKLLNREAGFETLIKLESTDADPIGLFVFASVPVAVKLYARLHGLGGTAGPAVLLPVYVKVTDCPPAKLAEAGHAPPTGSGVAAPSFAATPDSQPLLPVPWPVFLPFPITVSGFPT